MPASVIVAAEAVAAAAARGGGVGAGQPGAEVSNNKKSAKNYISRFVKVTGHTYAGNNLTKYKYAITGNGNDAFLMKSIWKHS